jgi:hypothetical protein
VAALRLSVAPTDNNDVFGLVEGSVCMLSSSIVVVASLSSYSQAVHYWAVDVSGSTPVVGPEAVYWSFDNTWAIPLMPDDPAINQFDTINDLSSIVRTGSTTFAMVGEPGAALPDGTWHAASFYSVDPSTLVITRTAICGLTDAETNLYFPEEQTSAAWGSKVVSISDHADSYLVIASPDGSTQILGIPGVVGGANSAVAVTGDTAVIATFSAGSDDMDWYGVDLNTGSVTGHGTMVDIGSDNWAIFSTTLPDGRIAYTSAGRYDERISASVAPVFVSVLDPATGAYERFQIPNSSATLRGWTGGWYSNVRDINCWPDGKIVVSWSDANTTPAYAVLDDSFNIIEQSAFDGAVNGLPSNAMFFYQTALPGQGRIVGTWSSPQVSSSDFGVYFLTRGDAPVNLPSKMKVNVNLADSPPQWKSWFNDPSGTGRMYVNVGDAQNRLWKAVPVGVWKVNVNPDSSPPAWVIV